MSASENDGRMLQSVLAAQKLHTAKGKNGYVYQFKLTLGGIVLRYGQPEDVEQSAPYVFFCSSYKAESEMRYRAIEFLNGYPTAGDRVHKAFLKLAVSLCTPQ